jgi:hypothetical protein
MSKFTIFIMVFLFVALLGGCISDKDVHRYTGIEKKDIRSLSDSANVEFVQFYKGSTDNWAATCFVYKMKGEELHTTKLLAKFIGGKSQPVGRLRFFYETEVSAGSDTLTTESKNGIFQLGDSSNGEIPSKNQYYHSLIVLPGDVSITTGCRECLIFLRPQAFIHFTSYTIYTLHKVKKEEVI